MAKTHATGRAVVPIFELCFEAVISLASEALAGVPEGPCNCNAGFQKARTSPANPMIPLPFRRPKRSATIDALYGMIVAQARSPSFYRGYGVPDVVEARIDMIMLHLVLVLRGLRGTADGQPMAQQAR